MTSKQFVLNGINKIVEAFPFVQCTYQFDRFSNLHSIEVLPEFYLNNPDGFSEIEYSFKKEFISKFPHERLSFFSKKNTIEIEEDNLVGLFTGRCYEKITSKQVEVYPEYSVHIPSIDSNIVDKEADYSLAA